MFVARETRTCKAGIDGDIISSKLHTAARRQRVWTFWCDKTKDSFIDPAIDFPQYLINQKSPDDESGLSYP